jgi:hypothetical protein
MLENTPHESNIAESQLLHRPVCPRCLQQGRRRPTADPRFVRHLRCIRCGTTWRLGTSENLDSAALER